MKKVLLFFMIFASIIAMVACGSKHTHTVTGELIVVKEATCGEDGIAYMFCIECGEIVNTISIPKTNDHIEVILPAKEATCEKSGLTEGKYCSACNNVIVEQKIISEKHSFGEWKTLKKATKTENGLAERFCLLCDKNESKVLPFIGSPGLEFTLNDDGESYTVTNIGTCTDTDVVIPKIYNELPVTGIADEAFFACTSLASVQIPDSVMSIGHRVFYSCFLLENIEVDKNNEYYCSINGNLYDKDVTTLIQYAIGKEDTSFNIPNSVTIVGNHAFAYCTSLTSVKIPDSVTSIDDYAFFSCSSLTSIEIPSSVTSISYCAFCNCNSLTSIEIPFSVTGIGEWVFLGCSSLASIEVDKNNEYYCSINGNLYDKDVTTLIQYAIGKENTSFNIPDSVTSIGNGAFLGCASLISIEIPDSVTSIGDCVFQNCPSITSIEILGSVTSIGACAFASCTSLTNVKIPNSVTSIGDFAFQNCTSIASITIPESVISIGNNVFEDCRSLTSIEIPDSVKSIGYCAFAYCSSLTSIEIPDSVTSIGECAFNNCTSLTSIVIPDSVKSISYLAFACCTSLTSIEIPDSVTNIDEAAFYGCTSLTSFTFEGTVEQWKAINKGERWNDTVPATKVICSNGTVKLK